MAEERRIPSSAHRPKRLLMSRNSPDPVRLTARITRKSMVAYEPLDAA
jgi:hypothetical protein